MTWIFSARGSGVFASVLLVPTLVLAQGEPSPPSEAQLADITARGRALAAYDSAAWHGSDAVTALKPSSGLVRRYLARQTAQGWVVAFGRLTARRDTFLIAYEALPASQVGKFGGFKGVVHSSPIADTDYYVRAARAIDTAAVNFGPVRRPYNSAVLPTPSGNWYVYFFPAPTVYGVWPLGADTRYTISADGRTILEKRRLHNSVIEFGAQFRNAPAGSQLEAGTHTAVLAEVPEDTDVFHVLIRTPRVPEYVMTDHFAYRIETDGKINFQGTH